MALELESRHDRASMMRLWAPIILWSLVGCGGIAVVDETAGGDDEPGTSPSPGGPGNPPGTGPDDPDPATCENVSGAWAGSWSTDSGQGGTWQVDWVETNDGDIAGSGVIVGTECGTVADIEGQRDGCEIRFGVVEFGGCDVEFGGSIDGDEMGGSFVVTAGLTDSGSWVGSRL